MKIIKEINDTEFVVKLEPQDYEKSRELNVVIDHDYVQFGRKMRLFREYCDDIKSVHKVCANVIPEYQAVQIPITALIEVILPLLNNHEYCQKEHFTFEGKKPQYTCSETNFNKFNKNMNLDNQEYKQKKCECWEEFCHHIVDKEEEFYNMFDRAYALGQQTETITQEEIEKAAEEYAEKEMENVSSWEWDSEYVQGLIEHAWYEGANFALGKQEKDGIDLKKLDEMLEDTLKKETKESLNQWLSEKDADTVIQGWVARNGGGPNDLGLHVYSVKPDRMKNRREWNGHGEMSYLIDCRLFPDLTWESEPIEVELIIKRKKK